MATEFEIKLRAGNVRQLEKILKDPQVAGARWKSCARFT